MINKDEIYIFLYISSTQKKLLCVHGRCEYCIEQFVKCKEGGTSEMNKRFQINCDK